jgi:hypothetical protein
MQPSHAYWGFPISAELHQNATSTIVDIRQADGTTHQQLTQTAATIVCQLTQHGLHNYYHKPVEIVPLPPVAKKTADTGIKAIMMGLDFVIRQFFKNRTPDELQAISNYLDLMLHAHPESGNYFLVFALNDDLYQRARFLIDSVRTDANRDGYIRAVVEALCELVVEGVRHYYAEPTRLTNFGGMTKKTADMSISQVQKGIQGLIKKLVSELNHAQLVDLSHHIEMMLHAPTDLPKACA